MRTFIISIIILCLCFGGCIINTAVIDHKINSALETLSTLNSQDIEDFTRNWEKESLWFTFTVKRTFLRDIADALQRLNAAANHDDDYEFEATKTALIYKMKELCQSQSFDIKSLL